MWLEYCHFASHVEMPEILNILLQVVSAKVSVVGSHTRPVTEAVLESDMLCGVFILQHEIARDECGYGSLP